MTHPAHNPVPTLPEAEIDVFLSKLRHDLRNTIRPLRELPKWIVEDLDEAGVEMTDRMNDNFDMLETYGARLSQMVEDLITYAHVGHGEDLPATSPSAVFQELTEGTVPQGFEVQGSFDHDALPLRAQDLYTVMDALLSNAIKHHDRDEGRVHVACKQTDLVVQLSVYDDGPGISADQHSKVFEALTTLHSRDAVEGSGMGLTIVRHIAQMNGGAVKLVSPDEARGTCVTVWFERPDRNAE